MSIGGTWSFVAGFDSVSIIEATLSSASSDLNGLIIADIGISWVSVMPPAWMLVIFIGET